MNFRPGVLTGRRRIALALPIALGLALPVIALAQSTDTPLSCSGKAKLDSSEPKSAHSVVWKLRCSSDIKSFSIVSSKAVDSFSASVPLDEESHKCEGSIPGQGFRCASKDEDVARAFRGLLSTDRAPCSRARGGRLRLWFVAVDSHGVSTEPERVVGPKCRKKRKRR